MGGTLASRGYEVLTDEPEVAGEAFAPAVRHSFPGAHHAGVDDLAFPADESPDCGRPVIIISANGDSRGNRCPGCRCRRLSGEGW